MGDFVVVFWKKKGGTYKRMKLIDGLSEATGIYQTCLRNIHTEFLANDRMLHHFKDSNKYRLLQ